MYITILGECATNQHYGFELLSLPTLLSKQAGTWPGPFSLFVDHMAQLALKK